MTVKEETMAKLDAYFGEYGGQYVPQILVPVLDQLEQAFIDAQGDLAFVVSLCLYSKNMLVGQLH